MMWHKNGTVFFIGMMAFCLCACGQNTRETAKETEISLQKNGSLVNTIVEEFDESLYDVENLRNMILVEVADFYAISGEKSITVDKVEASGGKTTVVMTYAKAEAYEQYNEKTCFYGTVSEAYAAGRNLEVTLASTKKGEEAVSREQLLTMGEFHILILQEPVKVSTYSKILYASENVELLSSKSARIVSDGEEPAYLILK